MENLPVKLLSELLTENEIATAENVVDTHEVNFCPIGISLPKESSVALMFHCYDEKISEFRYTPRAFFAVKVWETARNNLLKAPEFTEALRIEWYPVAATFNSVRFVNNCTERFIAAMREEMKKVADSRTIEIRYGRFDAPAIPERPDYPRRYYIMPQQLMIEKRGYGMQDELKPLQDSPTSDFSWEDIEDAFVILKPIQLAFIAGKKMNRHTPLDEEFLDACSELDLEKAKKMIVKGPNIHAANEYGDTAMDVMTFSYGWSRVGNDEASRLDNRNRFIKLSQYLLSLGYNINLAGYASGTCLDNSVDIDDLSIVKFLLDNGANPNIASYVGDYGEMSGRTVLRHVWDDECCDREANLDELELLLLSYGALPFAKTKKFTLEKAIEWLNDCSEIGAPSVVECAKGLFFYHLALRIQCGDDVNVKDKRGRNLLQIALEDAHYEDERQQHLGGDLAKMALMLLCGLKLNLSAEEFEQAKAICREKKYQEALNAISSVAALAADH